MITDIDRAEVWRVGWPELINWGAINGDRYRWQGAEDLNVLP